MTEKLPKQKTITTEEGNEYVLQAPTNRIAMRIIDEAGIMNDEFKIAGASRLILKEVVIQPQDLKEDDFDSIKELIEVCSESLSFLTTGK